MSTSTLRRKVVRKGTRSCWECRRRKVKCLPSPGASICAGCRERGTECLSQEYAEDPSPDPTVDGPALAQRVARVESLLETLVERISQSQGGGLTPESIPTTIAPGHSPAASRSNQSRLQGEDTGGTTGTFESLRARMTAMLPSQADVDCLFASSHGWWLLQQHMMPHLPDLAENDTAGMLNVEIVSQGHPLGMARLLLCIAICIQQLGPEAEILRQVQTRIPVREVESEIIKFITRNVTSDDENLGCIEGVECLALHGMYAVNAGNLRRSWLLFRKAITVGQLLGLHRALHCLDDAMGAKRHHLWYQISRGERYLSTILGIPSSTVSTAFPLDDNAPWLSPEDIYHKKLYHISGLILERNQGDCTHSFSTTLRISEQLGTYAAEMPHAWWEIPTVIPTTRAKESSSQFERIMCQIWHFELATLLHLPFMLRAVNNDRRFEYSRVECLGAARNLIRRWNAIRESRTSLLFSNLLEFQAFTAATTLLLGLLSGDRNTHPTIIQERYEDHELIQQVVTNFEQIAGHSSCNVGNSVSSQSIQAIRTLQRFLQPGDPSDRLRLEIPFFGVIRVARSGAILQPIQGERLLGANPAHTDLQPTPLTVGAFEPATVQRPASSSRPRKRTHHEMAGNDDSYTENRARGEEPRLHFSSNHFHLPQAPDIQGDLDSGEWDFQESDMVFFDSLVNTDLVGGWPP
ncbi:hypothetical protein BJX64DRAFT_300084 [Aspergillus heterothallicus]